MFQVSGQKNNTILIEFKYKKKCHLLVNWDLNPKFANCVMSKMSYVPG